jgi:hypothetical protein
MASIACFGGMTMKLAATFAILALGLSAAPAMAATTIVNISATTSGCTSYTDCSGGHYQPGQIVHGAYGTTVSFDPGSYTVTNGDGEAGANSDFTAWNYGSAWIWAFMAVDSATGEVVLDSLVPPYTGVFASGDKNAVATSAYATDYVGHFTVTGSPVSLTFFTEDYGPYDNAGGVALKIVSDATTGGVPEPTSWAMMLGGFAMIGGVLRRRASPSLA